MIVLLFFFFQAEDGIRDYKVTGVQTCALPISLADYAARMQDSVTRGVSRAMKTLEMTEQLTASRDLESKKTDSKATSDARQAFEQERNELLAAKNEIDARYREATTQIAKFEKEARDSIPSIEKEREK